MLSLVAPSFSLFAAMLRLYDAMLTLRAIAYVTADWLMLPPDSYAFA